MFVKIDYDKKSDAAYLYVVYPLENGAVKKSVPLSEDVVLDFDENEQLLGIEILETSKNESAEFLLEQVKK